MVVVILLLILAVLLFGSSAVAGAIGAMLGFLVALVALIYASITFDLTVAEIIWYVIGGIVTIFIVIFAAASIFDYIYPVEKRMLKFEAERKQKLQAMSVRERDSYLKKERKRAKKALKKLTKDQ